MERTIVFYHGGCPDGFGGAYAAWKKLGDTAEYIGLHRGEEIPDVSGAHTYFIDFVYDKEIMERLQTSAASLTALDHHEGVREVTESLVHHVFDNDRSGATIAWDYFHPGIPTPKLLQFIQDDDLFLFTLPDTRSVLAYLGVSPFTFEFWDETAQKLDDPVEGEILIGTMRAYGEYFEKLAQLAADKAHPVLFEGYEVMFATAHPYKPMKSLVGNLLAKAHPPFALVVAAHPEGFGVSIRGNGSIDVSQIAQKYGGNGHKSSAGFLIPANGPLPWTLIEDDEDTRD
ncbi:MAG TPA: hypothetical protein VEA92_02930 [Candidatus Paceibacterota bacterium]|nr:hypothetical protein [Candidatus Paceibacterota bacterium]